MNIPVFAKLSIMCDIVKVAKEIERGGADAVVAINTVGPACKIEIDVGKPVLGNKIGGLSGKAIKPLGIGCVYLLYKVLEIPIIGVGGISCGEDVIEYMMAGATAVQIGSAVVNGMSIFRKIEREMREYIGKRGLDIKDIVGMAHE